jgi:hypothetical protein
MGTAALGCPVEQTSTGFSFALVAFPKTSPRRITFHMNLSSNI